MTTTTYKLSLICVLIACAVSSACVTGRRAITLAVPASGAVTSASKGTIALTEVTDKRSFENKPSTPSIPSIKGDVTKASKDELKTMVGRQRNGYGKAMGDVQLAAGENVEQQMRRLIGEGLRRRGYTVTDGPGGANTAQVEIEKFWAWLTPIFVAVNFDANVSCKLTLKVNGKTKTLNVSGSGKNTGQVGSNANWELAYARAFEDFLTQLDTALTGAGL